MRITMRFFIGDRVYDAIAGREAYRENVLAHFLREAAAIDRHLELLGEVSAEYFQTPLIAGHGLLPGGRTPGADAPATAEGSREPRISPSARSATPSDR